MSKFNDLVKETGFASKQGDELFNSKLVPAIKEILSMATNENEVRVLQSLMSNRVGQLSSDRITKVNNSTRGELMQDEFTKAVERVVSEQNGESVLPESFVDPNVKPEELREATGVGSVNNYETTGKNTWYDPFEIKFDDSE